MPYPEQDQFGSKSEALDKAKLIGCYIDESSFHEMELEAVQDLWQEDQSLRIN